MKNRTYYRGLLWRHYTTSRERNLPFYKKVGFEVVGVADGLNYKLNVLKRP